jgi:nitroimidazol reductase NimA-like FMN-containing flavoprotein (pyridoxamine 5'-phosphate oxidase superfamily)
LYRHPGASGRQLEKDMADNLTPVSEKNLAAYDLAPLKWERALERLQKEWRDQPPPEFGGTPEPHTHWLATTRPDGRPHVVPVGMAWHQGAFYFTSGDGTQKSKNLAQNSQCVVTLAAKGLDVTLEGEARKVTDDAKLRRIAEVFASAGWAPTVRGGAFYHDFSAPSAGPPPWYVYEITPKTIYGFATAEPFGATRWRF